MTVSGGTSKNTLKSTILKTNILVALKIGLNASKERIVSQPSIFRGYVGLLVSGRVFASLA